MDGPVRVIAAVWSTQREGLGNASWQRNRTSRRRNGTVEFPAGRRLGLVPCWTTVQAAGGLYDVLLGVVACRILAT